MRRFPRIHPAPRGISRRALLCTIGLVALTAYVALDYWSTIPDSATAAYVGRAQCIQCHKKQTNEWTGSDHDRAMELATPETVLADFNDVELRQHGVPTKFRREGSRFFVETEGPDGAQTDYEVTYVFGCQPLQQYMVEVASPASGDAMGRVQVLRWSWDTERNEWFYLQPPDVDDRLLPDDPLHWTGIGQNWNHMCAECHSTNLNKNYDVMSRQYATTFCEIDVSCEACHGPASVHVQLAKAPSLFWDRQRRFGLETDLKKDQISQIDACAPCHARRRRISPHWVPGDNFDDHFATQLLAPDLYYPDGQILDEVYVYGSFLQSKMYEKEIKCSDCHNPHSGRVKFSDNRLCTSCHQHSEAKYDTPAHHHHKVGSTGASCIDCHMPETPYMDVDYRRDHKLDVPRPDLSVKFQTPNACTGCHLDQGGLAPERSQPLGHYSHWLAAARRGDKDVAVALHKADSWANEKIQEWYGPRDRDQSTTEAFYLAWHRSSGAGEKVLAVANDRRIPAFIRASAVALLPRYRSVEAQKVILRSLKDRQAIVRAAATAYFEEADVPDRVAHLVPLLSDPVRLVRLEAADVLAAVPRSMLSSSVAKLDQALDERRAALMVDGDLASTHIGLALLAERQRDPNRAVKHYLQAIHVQPTVAGPRTNLAALYEQTHRAEEARVLREEELPLIERDAKLAPDNHGLQYRLGLYYYTLGQLEKVEPHLLAAHRMDATNSDYLTFLALYYEKMERWDEAIETVEKLIELDSTNPSYQQMSRSIREKAGVSR
jgi:tetratricopeptide (TPR) repeat protein